MKTKICSIICVLCLLLCSAFVLISCNSEDVSGIVSARVNDSGELVLTYSDGKEQNLGDVVTLKILRGGEEKTVSITITEECLTEY